MKYYTVYTHIQTVQYSRTLTYKRSTLGPITEKQLALAEWGLYVAMEISLEVH